ncbi:MAG: glycosyl hydrolase [Ignavibacteria bacterium]|nr:glycosyl hydrolase [Ignavibacteria bacterium]
MKKLVLSFAVSILFFTSTSLFSQKSSTKAEPDSLKKISLSGLQFRNIGPAITGGRVRHIKVNPQNKSEYYIASGSGSLWKTVNRGITFSPSFENQNTYAIGAVEIDPTNPNILWVGTGENSNHNNSGYGDGFYKSEDGGKSWNNMGLKTSEHIGGIAIDPIDPNIVYAAAMGSLRKEGGERGIFKTTDGGKTWQNVLKISQYTGCYEVFMDPRNSKLLYAVAHQRMRKLYTGVYGGPESGIYKSTDAGTSWNKLKSGLPSDEVGRIGMAISPVNSDVLYAIIDAKKDGGFYKSTDRGASWSKQNSYVSAYTFYFQKIYCDVKDVNRVYSMDVFIKITNDGGKTWTNLGEKNKHVDNHGFWIDPDDNKHLISGCDGGVYETYDQGQNWAFRNNIPITEIYKVATDNALPFYNVYIGTQDNNSLFGPSRTINSSGITNQDWTFTLGGDGFQSQVDWQDPNTVYAQSQNGGLVRFDKKSGEKLYIRPYDFADTSYRFDWDAPLLISRHDHKRLYFGGNKLFRSNDQGNTWDEISGDLTRGYPANFQKLMGKSWSMDEMVNKSSMAQIVTIAESPLDENVLFAGSGDGLIHYSDNGGKTWTKASSVEGLPQYARVHQIIASNFNKLVAYAACHNFHDGDYRPYLYKTEDGGKTWKQINSNLPEMGSTYTIAEDFVDGNLLFVGTQFGVFFSNNGGKEWIQLKNGLPTIQVFNLKIQERETDLVISTFGRGVYILDNYSPLRFMSKETLTKDAFIFPIKDAQMFIPADPFGYGGIGSMGASFFATPNPQIGTVINYFVKDEVISLKDKRRELEKEKQKKGEDVPFPTYDELKKESEQPEAFLLFTISDDKGNVVKKIKTGISKGLNKLVWDFRYDTFSPISNTPFDNSVPWNEPEKGYMAVPGKYKVFLTKFEDGIFTELCTPQEFNCVPLNLNTLTAPDKESLDNFNKKVAELTRVITGADAYRNELVNKLSYFKKAVFEAPKVPTDTYNKILAVSLKLDELNKKFSGDNLRSKYEGGTPTALRERVELITSSLWSTTSAPTTTFVKSYEMAANSFGEILKSLTTAGEEVEAIEKILKENGAPYTPGRFPNLETK